ncbi:MAG TPA: helix-turn-helix domain-containing protein [Vicinamibacteria bacterium]|nr:helix-turn-helix domain-containing protein [Vicinamibacteria bacterium]
MTREELRRLRAALGLSKREMARRIGVAPRTIARWESGEHPIGLVYEKLIRLQADAARVGRGDGA